MAYAVFTLDGSSLVLADVFGVTRIALGKAVKVKHSAKVSSAHGVVSVNGTGTAAFVQGRVHTSAYGNVGSALVALPGVGLRAKLSGGAFATMLCSPGGVDRLASMSGDELQLHVVEGDAMRRERAIKLSACASRVLDAVHEGSGAYFDAVATLTTTPDGRFVALGDGAMYAGRLAASDGSDEVWWRLPLTVGHGVSVSLAMDGDNSWLFLRRLENDHHRCIAVTRDGVVSTHTCESLATPAVCAGVMLTQPESGVVVATTLADGSTVRYDVSGWNTHPADAPAATVYKGATPTFATRLPGILAMSGTQRWFVPWHRESVVDLTRGSVVSRGLEAAVGPMRRLILERLGALDDLLRSLRVTTRLLRFEVHTKDPRVSLDAWRSRLVPGLWGHVVAALGYELTERYELATHKYHYGSFGTEGGYATDAGAATLDEVRALLAWMRAKDVLPSDAASAFADTWDRGLGIPSGPVDKAFLAEGAGERMILRALFETLAHDGWPEGPVSDAWATEALTVEHAKRANAARKTRTRYLSRRTPAMLGKMLARNLGADAMPLLLELFAAAAREGSIYDEVRALGEAITFVVHHHPERQEEALLVIDNAIASGVYAMHNTRYELELTRERVGRRARHFWSNA